MFLGSLLVAVRRLLRVARGTAPWSALRSAGLRAALGVVAGMFASAQAMAAGYTPSITTAYPWINISASAPQVVMGACNSGGMPSAYNTCDDGVSWVMDFPSGFTFPFAGTNYTKWSLHSNGVLFLEPPTAVTGATSTAAASGGPTYTVSNLPTTNFGSPARAALFIFWTDLLKNASVAGANNVGQPANASFYQWELVTMPSGSKVFVVQLKNIRYFAGATYVNMQFQLWDNGAIVYTYGNIAVGGTATNLRVGLQSAGGTYCHTLANNITTALSNQSYLYQWDAAAAACPTNPSVNHYELRHDGAATLCADPVTVLACSSGVTPCPAANIINSIIMNVGLSASGAGTTIASISPAAVNLSPSSPVQTANFTWASGSAGTSTLAVSPAVLPTGALTCATADGSTARACTVTVSNTACIPPPHHYEVQGPASGTNCAASTFTIKAWADAAQTTAYTAGVATGTLTGTGNPVSLPSLGAFTIPAGSSTVNVTPISFPSAGTTTFNTTATPALAGATTCKFGASTSCAFPVVACAPHHLELQGPAAGVTCLANTYTVKAWADAAQTVAYTSAAVTGNVTATGTPTVTYPAGSGFTIPSGSSSTTVSVGVTTPGSVTLGTSVSSSAPAAATTCNFGSPTCTYTATDTGFIFSDTATGAAVAPLPQTAGTASSMIYLRAVQTNTSTGACQAGLTSPASVTMRYNCLNPASCSSGSYLDITPYNGATAQTVQSVAPAGTALNLYFDANGSAPLVFNYRDVGQISLSASKAAGGSLLKALSGVSGAFVVKPGGFSMTSIKRTALPLLSNPAAVDAAGAVFVKAGEAFTASVSALTSGGAVTPNFGRENTPEGVTLTPSVVLPTLASGGSDGALTGATVTNFVSGVATPTNLAWSEVGILSLAPSLTSGNYLGSAGAVSGTASGNIGRFIPDHFAVTPGVATHACSNAFNYFGQDGLSTAFTVTAQNVANATTTNYQGLFAKLGVNIWTSFGFSAATLAAGSVLAASATAPTGSWGTPANGQAAVVARHVVSRPTALTGETLLTLSALPVDSDGVTMPASVALASNAPYRYGRLRVLNYYGSELLPARVEYRAEFFSGVGWGTNTLDNCSTPAASNFALPAGLTLQSVGALNNGVGFVKFNTAAVGNYDIAINLGSAAADNSCNTAHPASTGANRAWLKTAWCGAGGDDPNARIRLGSPKAPYIYLRERY